VFYNFPSCAIADDYGIKPYKTNAGKENNFTITTLTTGLEGTPMFLNSYVDRLADVFIYKRLFRQRTVFQSFLLSDRKLVQEVPYSICLLQLKEHMFRRKS